MKCLRWMTIAVLVSSCAFAQQKPPTTPPTPPAKPDVPVPKRPSNPNKPNSPTSPDQQMDPGLAQDVLVTGRLVMPDGMPPADMVPVSLNCGLSAADITGSTSDLRGEFRLRLRASSGPNSDRLAMQNAMRCSVLVAIPGFEPIKKELMGMDLRGGGDVGMLVLRPLLKAEATIVSLNGLKAPEPARQELIKAREDLAKEKLKSARSRLEKAVKIYPEYATAWFELGRLQARQGETERAATSYRQSAKTDPKYINPLVELALMAAVAQQWPEAEQHSESVLRMAPNGLPGVYLVHAIACFNQKKMDAAEKSARGGLDQDKSNQFPKLLNLLGDVLLLKGDKEGAADAFRQYLERAPQSPNAEKIRQQLAALSK